MDPMNSVLLLKTQHDDAKSALCDLAVIILGLNITASSQDEDSNSTTTDSEGTCDEADFDKLMDQHDHEARSKRRRLEETANTSATVHKNLASVKADFCDTVKTSGPNRYKKSELGVKPSCSWEQTIKCTLKIEGHYWDRY